MEKRSRRRIRDLVARPASLGLSENEIGCARISMMARNTNVPFKGRIQKRKTYHLQIITFRLQRAAGPYSGARARNRCVIARCAGDLAASAVTRGERRELLSLNQLCQRNCCGLRAEPCEITTLTRAGPRKFIASSRAPRRSFGSSTKKPLPPKASITLSYRAP